jgi:NAD+-dependent secondary alcohol dehydrogenase Adh1
MKVVRVVGYHQNLKLDEAPQPEITSPLDVIVKIGAAGVCRTDLHILEGQWEEKAQVKLPYTIGHEVCYSTHICVLLSLSCAVG